MAITHDGFFKSLMEEPGAAGALLRERLPAEVVAQLAPGEPERVPETFVDPRMRERLSDRLFRVRLLSGAVAYIYCLIEHKSRPDPRVGLQLLVYLTRVWERLDREAGHQGPLPPVTTLLVYHGAQRWKGPTRFSGLLGGPEGLKPHLLDFPIHVVDVGRVDENELSKHRVLSVGLLVLKYASRTDAGNVVETVTLVLTKMRGLPQGVVERFWRYISVRYAAVNRRVLSEALRRAMPGKEEEMISIAAQEWLAEGRAEGLAEGRAEGRAQAKAETLARLLEKRFGPIPARYAKKLAGAPVEQLDDWLDRVLDAATLAEVFARPTH